MSIADTADYQLSMLADVMTTAVAEAEEAGYRSQDYQDGFTDALDIIARAMNLKSRTVYTY